jgi:hypothetical protein
VHPCQVAPEYEYLVRAQLADPFRSERRPLDTGIHTLSHCIHNAKIINSGRFGEKDGGLPVDAGKDNCFTFCEVKLIRVKGFLDAFLYF